MTTVSFGQLREQAKKEGFGSVLPDGTHVLEVVGPPKADKGQGGKPRISTKVKIVGGPNDGASGFYNQTLTLDNPKAMAVFFRQMEVFGLDDAYFAGLGEVTDEAISKVAADAFRPGFQFEAKVSHHDWKGQPKNDIWPNKPVAAGTPGLTAPAVAAAPTVHPDTYTTAAPSPVVNMPSTGVVVPPRPGF